MEDHQLINLDLMEASVVRRRLRQWSKGDERPVLPLITALQDKRYLIGVHINDPRWETNVCPLYYWAYRKVGSKKVYDYVFDSLPTLKVPLSQDDLRVHVRRIVNSEIDILVEDLNYFVFIEAKEAMPGQKIIFQDRGGVRQLVRQYLQGKILQKFLGKAFALAAIGANNAQPININLNEIERGLLQLVDEKKESLEVIDLSWPETIASVQTIQVMNK